MLRVFRQGKLTIEVYGPRAISINLGDDAV
jgi:hypothetical protein